MRTVRGHFSLGGSFYRAFRAPTLNELYRGFRVGNVVTNANQDLRAERLTGGEGGFAFRTFAERVTLRTNFFWSEIHDPIANVTVSSTPALITRRRQNLGAIRARGLESSGAIRVTEHLQFAAEYLLTDSVVLRFPVNPALDGLMVPQIPRHQFNFQIDYAARGWVTGLQGRMISTQFDDDQNLLPLKSYFTLDASLSRAVSKQVTVFMAAQNLTGGRYEIGRTPLLTVGPPAIVRIGLRVSLHR
jgi:outer membrane receptor protein involved in Fe transport